MNRSAAVHTLRSFVSRCLSRDARTLVRTGGDVSRLIFALAAAGVLLAAQTIRFGREGSAVTLRSASSPAPHFAPSHRLALASRPPVQWQSGSDAALLNDACAAARDTLARESTTIPARASCGASVVARGYDATAPPPLS